MKCKCLGCCKEVKVTDDYYTNHYVTMQDLLVKWNDLPCLICSDCKKEISNKKSLIHKLVHIYQLDKNDNEWIVKQGIIKESNTHMKSGIVFMEEDAFNNFINNINFKIKIS